MTTPARPHVCPYCGITYIVRYKTGGGKRIPCYNLICEEKHRVEMEKRARERKKRYKAEGRYKGRYYYPCFYASSKRPLRKCVKCSRSHRGYFELCSHCQNEIRQEMDTDWLFQGSWNKPKSIY
jgi:hypothetical protein